MGWLSSFVLLLYLSLLCTGQSFVEFNQPSSLLAQGNPVLLSKLAELPLLPTEQNSSSVQPSDEDPDRSLPLASCSVQESHHGQLLLPYLTQQDLRQLLVSLGARGPPAISSVTS